MKPLFTCYYSPHVLRASRLSVFHKRAQHHKQSIYKRLGLYLYYDNGVPCDREDCPGVCEDKPERLDALCLVRYVWSYERCTIKRFHRQENARLAAIDEREAELLDAHVLSPDRKHLQNALIDRAQWIEDRLNDEETTMAEEIRLVVSWVTFLGGLLTVVQRPVTEGGKRNVARVLENKPSKDVLILKDNVHSFAQLMVLQAPPRIYLSLFIKEEREKVRRRNLPPIPLFDDKPPSEHAGPPRAAQGGDEASAADDRDLAMESTEDVPQHTQSSRSPEASSSLNAESRSEERSPGGPSASTSRSLTSPGDERPSDKSTESSIPPEFADQKSPTKQDADNGGGRSHPTSNDESAGTQGLSDRESSPERLVHR